MDEFIVKHAKDLKDVALFVLCVYLIWSDRMNRKEERRFIEHLLAKKEKECEKS